MNPLFLHQLIILHWVDSLMPVLLNTYEGVSHSLSSLLRLPNRRKMTNECVSREWYILFFNIFFASIRGLGFNDFFLYGCCFIVFETLISLSIYFMSSPSLIFLLFENGYLPYGTSSSYSSASFLFLGGIWKWFIWMRLMK